MGTSANPHQLAAKLGKLADAVGDNRREVSAAALAAKVTIIATASRKVPSMRLRNVGRAGSKLGVRYDVKGQRNATALVRATGPWQLVERDTKPHTITGRRAGGKRGRGKKALRLPDGQVRGIVQHPGTRGKHPWEDGVKAATPVAVRAYWEAQVRSITNIIK